MAKKCIECGNIKIKAKGLCQKCYSRQYYQKNSDVMKKQTKKWIRNNPERFKIINDRSKLKKKGQKTMSENKECALFLGVHVAEKVLSMVFKDVVRQPHGNPSFDFICNNGKKIDVKSACMVYRKWRKPSWNFTINKNKIADYFLCLAFDNRKNLNPVHIWLIMGDVVNTKTSITSSVDTYHKWDKYALDINKVSKCCDVMRGTHT